MYINFRKAQYWVPLSEFRAYLSWRWRQAKYSPQVLREILRSIWGPRLHQSLDGGLAYVVRRAEELDVQPGWIRCPAGTRIQVFDRRGDRICKVSKKDVPFTTIPTEIGARSYASVLAPTILQISHDRLAFVEEWVQGRSLPDSLDVLIDAVGKLQKHLYAIEYVDRQQYCNLLSTYGGLTQWEEHILDYAISFFHGRLLPVSRVHGDLTYDHVWYNPERGLVLLDWEYSRKCLVTFDCWLYVYCHYRRADYKSTLPDEYPSILFQLFQKLNFDFSPRDALVLHLFHLIEQHSLLSHMPPGGATSFQQAIEADIDRALMSLAKEGSA